MNSFFDEELYKVLFDNSLDAILLMSIDGVIYRANPAACQMFQVTEYELCKIGREGISDINDRRLYQYAHQLETHGEVRGELFMVRRDGTRFPAEISSKSFFDKQGKQLAVTSIRDMSEHKQAEEDLRGLQRQTEYHATYDYLTGILNRRAFVDKLNQEMNRAHRDRMPMSLILMDVDRFKEINDCNGHLAGDIVLKKVAQCLSDNLRSYDILGRYGGDEFILCLPNTAYNEAVMIAERLRNYIEQTEIKNDTGKIKVTASLGVVCHYYTSPSSIDDLIAKVDDNMYNAKRQNNCVYARNEPS